MRGDELLPHRARVHYNCGLALQTLGMRPDAEAALMRAYELAPLDPEIVNALAILHVQDESWERALVYAEALVGLVPNDPAAHAMLQRIRREL